MEITRRRCLEAAALLSTAPQFRLLAAQSGLVLTPERFGAVGDGVTNDTAAFAKMAAFVIGQGGGKIVLRRTTYIVGQQTHRKFASNSYAFEPADILTFKGCTKPLIIVGNGARLKCADGLRFGTFDPGTGRATRHSMPYTARGEWSSPYIAMILIQNCTGDIVVENVELDGNLAKLNIGGPYGDTGRQLPGDGLRLSNNLGTERITQVYTHHHARDGILIDGAARRQSASMLERVRAEHNVRQGCSLVRGCNYSFADSRFNHTGRAGLMSAPGAGIDIEAETTPIRNLRFVACEFSNNSGVGMVADSGDSADVTFENCRFIGTTTWSAWPKKPGFRFIKCAFVGAVAHPFADADPNRATHFLECTFLDDHALSPTGKVYGPSQPIVNMAVSENVLFDACRFNLKSDLVLPWSWKAHYNNCTMFQVSPEIAHPKGTYTGVCSIVGAVELYGAVVKGHLTVNGKVIPRTID